MYAERYQVRTWLEEPARWLAWAMDSMVKRNLKDAHYNLSQFWKELEAWKARQLSGRQWGEVMTLDSQANWVLGNWYDASASLVMQGAAEAQKVTGVLQYAVPAVGIGAWLGEKMGWTPERSSLKAILGDLQTKRAEAYRNAQTLARKAKEALATAKAPEGQAGNAVTVTSHAVERMPSTERFEQSLSDQFFKPILDELPAALKAPFGVPWYWWAAGAAALVLLPILLAPTPRVTISRD